MLKCSNHVLTVGREKSKTLISLDSVDTCIISSSLVVYRDYFLGQTINYEAFKCYVLHKANAFPNLAREILTVWQQAFLEYN